MPVASSPPPKTPPATRTAAAAPAPQPPPKAPSLADQARAFVDHYEASYRDGDLERFVALFTPDGADNKTRGEAALRKTYSRIFGNTATRRLDIVIADIRRTADNQLTVDGRFSVTLGYRNGRRYEHEGPIQLWLIEQGGALKAARLAY